MSSSTGEASLGKQSHNTESSKAKTSKSEKLMSSSKENLVLCSPESSSVFQTLKAKFEIASACGQNLIFKNSPDRPPNSKVEVTADKNFPVSQIIPVNNCSPKVDASTSLQTQIPSNKSSQKFHDDKSTDSKADNRWQSDAKAPSTPGSNIKERRENLKSESIDQFFNSRMKKNSDDCNDLNGDLLKNIELLKSLLSSGKMFDFPETVLTSLLEVHEMTSIIPLMLENRRTQKLLYLSDEIYWMSVKNNFDLADLKLSVDNPEENLKIVSLVASFKQHAKYIRKTAFERHPFKCKACGIMLATWDLAPHFSGIKHHRRVLEIAKLAIPPLSTIVDKMLQQIPAPQFNDEVAQSISNTHGIIKNPSIPPVHLDRKPSNSSIAESLKSSEDEKDLNPELLSHFQTIVNEQTGHYECWCIYCQTMITGPLNIKNLNLGEHARGAKHRAKVSQFTTKTKSVSKSDGQVERNDQILSQDKPSTQGKAVSKPHLFSEKYAELMSSVMKKHIKGEVPLTYESNDVGFLGYYCDICRTVATNDDDWLLHLDNHDHKRNAAKHGSPTCLYHCLVCKIVIFCSAVTSGTSHDHVFSYEHICIRKLVEKKCPEIQRHVQENSVLTIRSEKSSCNSVCLNVGEVFVSSGGEVANPENNKISRTKSSKLDSSAPWILSPVSTTPKRHRLASRTENNDNLGLDYDESSETESSGDEYEDKDVEDILTELLPNGEARETKKDGKTSTSKANLLDRKKKANADGTPTNRKKNARRRDRPGHSLTFKGLDNTVSSEEWTTRFIEMGRLKSIAIDFDEGKATVTFSKRSSVLKILGSRDIFLDKYDLEVDDTAQKNLDQTCKTLFENEHEFMNKILTILNIIDDELNLPDSKLRLTRLKTSVLCAIRSSFPDCKIYEFGSRVSGLATNESDYDLFLDLTGTMYQGTKASVDSQMRVEMIKAIRRITNIFRQMPNEFTALVPITSARVPILKFKHVKTNSNCDLSFKNGLSVENTKLVRKYLNMNPKVRWLVIAVKSWAHACGLLSSSDFTTYAVTWLVLFFLMSKKLVPSVASFMFKSRNVPLIQGWRCSFDDTEVLCEINDSNVQLLLDFFDFYENFEFWKFIICTRSGTHFRKFILVERVVHMMPNEIKDDYCSSVSKSDRDKDFNVGACSVQDPFDLSHNITKQVRPYVLKSFQRYCSVAASQIRKWPPFQV
nr:PREDICTED: uncharacterized protein LOC109034524 [Bemisia tabaci]